MTENNHANIEMNVNGKKISGAESQAIAREIGATLTKEIGNALHSIAKSLPSANINADSLLKKIQTSNVSLSSLREVWKTANLDKLKEQLPVIDATHDDGKIGLNLNGKPLLQLDLSRFTEKK
ncbi:hypothetical protein J9303_08435 [Bacillaceae bacterium Marseille-Q3522]|nr:hypothetical protein [Bacillaceae bacterium Marseille-Q3522]